MSKKHRTKVGESRELTVEDIATSDTLTVRRNLGDLDVLENSIREQGIIEPLVVRPANGKEGKYELVCGHRRFQAMSNIGGWQTVPAYIRTDLGDDLDALSVAAIENSEEARTALDPVDRARLFRRFMDEEEGATEKTVARRMGCSKQTVRSGLKLLKMAPDVLKKAQKKELSGYAMCELAGYDRATQDAVLKKLKKADSADRIKFLVNELSDENDGNAQSKKPRAVRWRPRREMAEKFDELVEQNEREREPFVSGAIATFLWVRGEIEKIEESVVGTPIYVHGIDTLKKTLRGKARGKKAQKK